MAKRLIGTLKLQGYGIILLRAISDLQMCITCFTCYQCHYQYYQGLCVFESCSLYLFLIMISSQLLHC